MKRILVTGSGGSPSTNFIRSLKAAKEKFHIVGTDSSKYYLQRSEADKNYLVPECSHPKYIAFLNYIIEKEKIDFLHVQNDIELEMLSKNRDSLKTKMFLPSDETVQICLNKFKSYELWEKVGIKVPRTMLINTEDDLKKAFQTLGNKLWLRDIKGAGGKGSLPVDNIKAAVNWINFKNGWGHFTAAELLKDQSVTWMSIWKDGELVVAQGRKRLYWELSKISPSGVTGATGGAITYSDSVLDDIAQKAIFAIDKKPHGIFSVDLTYDQNDIPNPTEINIGRFFTTHEFFTRAGLNMPEIFVKLAFNEQLPVFKKKVNPLPDGLMWIRGIDFVPVLTTVKKVEEDEKALKSLLAELKNE